MKKLLEKIGGIFTGLFNASQRVWNRLPAPTRQSIVDGSALLNEINQNSDMTAQELADSIQQKFPNIGVDKLQLVAQQYNLEFDEGDYVSVVGAIQGYLKPLQGKFWANASDAISKTIALLLAPPETKFAVLASLMTWAYHRFVKKDDQPKTE